MCCGGPPHNRRAESLALGLISTGRALRFRFGLSLCSAFGSLAFALGIGTSSTLRLRCAIGLSLLSLLARSALAAIVLVLRSGAALLAALGVALGTLGALGIALAAFTSLRTALSVLGTFRRLA